MFLYELSTPPRVARFKDDPVVYDYAMSWYQTPEEFAGPDAELMEDLYEIDGTKFDVAPLTANLGGLARYMTYEIRKPSSLEKQPLQ